MGALPGNMFQSFPHADFGFYGYNNGFRRWNFFKSISLEEEAQVLVDTLRDSPYQTIALMGHSLGGVLIRIAIAKMIEMKNEDLLSRIRVVFFFAVPQQGAHSLPRIFGYFNSDAAALARNSSLLKRTTRVFLDHFNTDEIDSKGSGSWLPIYCIQAAEDFWVEELSSTLNIRTHMRKVVRATHTSVVKGLTGDVGNWVDSKLKLFLRPPLKHEPTPAKMIRHGPKTIR